MLQRGRNIHRNNRLNKPRLRYIKIHGEGFRQWHISKKRFRATYRVIGSAEIILQSDNTTKKPDMGTQIFGFLQIRDIPWSEQHICSNSSEECQQGNSAKNRSILQPKPQNYMEGYYRQHALEERKYATYFYNSNCPINLITRT